MLFTPPPPARCPESRWRRRRWWAWVGRWASVNIHSRVYVHMYTYVQTRRGPGQAAPGTRAATLSPPFPLAEGRRAGEKTKARAWSDSAGPLVSAPRDRSLPRVLRGGGSSVCVRVCVRGRGGMRVHLCPLGPQPPRGLSAQSC